MRDAVVRTAVEDGGEGEVEKKRFSSHKGLEWPSGPNLLLGFERMEGR
jgi:hypothetical protein